MSVPHYSISVRLRRTIVEEVHVRVPVTQAVMGDDDHLDGGKVFAAAVRIGQVEDQRWRVEGEPAVELHPMQTPPPEYDS